MRAGRLPAHRQMGAAVASVLCAGRNPGSGFPMRALFALLTVAAVLLVAAPVSANAGGDSARCMGCDAIIALCQKLLHFTCVEMAGPTDTATRCAISLCATIDNICAREFGARCLA